MTDTGIRMTGYKRVRLEYGTMNYPYQSQRKNLYEPISRKLKKDLEFLSEQENLKKPRNKSKKRIEIREKKDLLTLLMNQDQKDESKDTESKDKESKDNQSEDKESEDKESKEQVGGSLFKKICVSNINPDKKKGKLVL